MRFSALCLLATPLSLLAEPLLFTPQACIVTKPDTPCLLQLTIQATTAIDEPSCVYRSDMPHALTCVPTLQPQQKIQLTLQITQATELALRTADGRLVAQQTIDYATYQPVTTRRRRGLGWNLL